MGGNQQPFVSPQNHGNNDNSNSNKFEASFPTNWGPAAPESKSEFGTGDGGGFPGFPPAQSGFGSAAKPPQQQQQAQINPFTGKLTAGIPRKRLNNVQFFSGATNLAQLNTSPWPTTGTSPVQNDAGSGWPPMAGSAGQQSAQQSSPFPPQNNPPPPGMSGFSAVSAGVSGFHSGSGFGGNFVTNGQSTVDPFGAAPASNIQQSGKNYYLTRFQK